MTEFRYRAASPEGEAMEGVLDAPDRQMAIRQLKAMSLRPLSITEGEKSGILAALNKDISFGAGARMRTRRDFARDLSTLLSADARMAEALEIIGRERGEQGALAVKIQRRVSSGDALSEAVADEPGLFDPASVAILQSGERSGDLANALAQLAEMTDATLKLRSEILSSLAYPIALGLATAGALSLLVFFVLPSFEGLFGDADGDLPWLTVAVFEFGWIARTAAPYIGGGVLLLLAGGGIFAGTAAGRKAIDAGVLRAPIIGDLATGFKTARFAIVFGRLLASGERAERALRLTADGMGNQVFTSRLLEAADEVESGAGLASALTSAGVLPERALRLIEIGERSGRVSEISADIAAMYDLSTRERTRRILAAIPPILTVGIGLAVALLVFAVLTTLLSVNDLAFQ